MQSHAVELSFPQRYVQERAERYNEQVMTLFLAETDWHLFDVFSVNRPVLYATPPLYADGYHFPGLLTQIGWHIILPMLCPEALPAPSPSSTPPSPSGAPSPSGEPPSPSGAPPSPSGAPPSPPGVPPSPSGTLMERSPSH